MRLAFLGTPRAAVPTLEALVRAHHDVELVITRPDRKRGRGSRLTPSPVKEAALDLGLRVGHSLKDLDLHDVERGVVVAYGALIPASLLERTPMLNVHFSLLPRWRGAAPVERSILAGDDRTGVCVMSLEATLDTGPVHACASTVVADKTAAELTGELAHLGADLLVRVLASKDLLEHPVAQEGEVTYAEKLTKETFHVQPTMPVALSARTVRLGRAYCFVGRRRLRVLRCHVDSSRARAGSVSVEDGAVRLHAKDGSLVLEEVQPEGSRAMSAHAWWSGARLDPSVLEWT
jgi:methionyl-tRNA formyltransferase